MIKRTAQAGTLESSDCVVTISPGKGISLDYRGTNAMLFQKRTHTLVEKVLKEKGIGDADIQIQDQGALEPTMVARITTALARASKEA
ncbi:MAG TPA: citrate lyase acyl carrier protein [Synergistaceae bacterium]|nr:citrate lyase acyl carrier protein [Synergistaceae bacterium]HPJ24540.1 citrate lyase acyl carrier protein [Synergistaceae bacterium]HPQ36297.1 citrate lyase acyl carrier protein [Synergistaceae bacterium]